MKKIILIVLGILGSLILLEGGLRLSGFLIQRTQRLRNIYSLRSGSDITIICLGESTTADGYPAELETILNERNIGRDFTVLNLGIGGTNTGVILSRVEEYIDEYEPDIVVAMMGINDQSIAPPVKDSIYHSKDFLYRTDSLRVHKLFALLKENIETALRLPKDRADESESIEEEKSRFFRDLSVNTIIPDELYSDWINENYHEYRLLTTEDFLSPDASHLLQQLSGYYIKLERYEKADKVLETGPERLAEAAHVLEDLTNPLNRMGKYTESAAILRIGLKLAPKDPYLLRSLGHLYMKKGLFDTAEPLLLKAYSLSPDDPTILKTLSDLYVNTYRYEKAVPPLNKLFKQNPYDLNIIEYLVDLHVLYEKYEEAEAILKLVRRLDISSEFLKHMFIITEQQRESLSKKTTADNYNKLMEILSRRGIPLVAVQYPVRPLDSLKAMLGGVHKGLYYVNNEEDFKRGVDESGYSEYFVDIFAGDFGHMTLKGKRLLSKNIADVIEKKVLAEYQ